MVKKETHTSENAKLYELGFHILPTVAEDKVAEVFSEVTGIISKNNGTVVKSGEPKAIKLAYVITKKIKTQNKKFDSAYFSWIKFEGSADDIENIKNSVEENENILRFIVLKTVDDDEHSTAKLVEDDSENEAEVDLDTEKEADNKSNETEAEEDVVDDTEIEDESDSDTEEKEESEKPEPKAKKSLDEIDEAIDELVG